MRNAVRLSAFYPANKSTTIKKDREGQPPGLLFLELEAEAGLRSLGSGLLKRLIGIASLPTYISLSSMPRRQKLGRGATVRCKLH